MSQSSPSEEFKPSTEHREYAIVEKALEEPPASSPHVRGVHVDLTSQAGLAKGTLGLLFILGWRCTYMIRTR